MDSGGTDELWWRSGASNRWSVVFCAATDCWVVTDGHRYCSDRCKQRETKRRMRYRRLLRHTGTGCLACGVRHRPDGSVWLAGR